MAQNSSKSSKAKLKSRSVACVSNKHRKTSPRWASDGPFSYDALKRLAGWLRPFIKPFLLCFAICLVSLASIMRASVPYADDMAREFNGGYDFNSAFNRYSASMLSYVLNANRILQNLSPLTWVIAMAIVAIGCVIVTYNLCQRKIKYAPLILSCVAVVNPLAIGCWVFIYDAPGMALSFLASILPIVFWWRLLAMMERSWSEWSPNDKRYLLKFGLFSTASLLIMWTSYQAMSGFLPVLVCSMAFIGLLYGRKLRVVLKTAVLYAVPYILAAILFLVIFPSAQGLDGYRAVSMPGIAELPIVVLRNLHSYVSVIVHSLNKVQTVVAVLIVVGFLVSVCQIARKGKALRVWQVLLLTFVFLAVVIPISYGAYILLDPPASIGIDVPFGRTSVGAGLVAAIVLMITAIASNEMNCWLLIVPGMYFLYICIAYNIALGNALDGQHDYTNFRVDEALYDIARFDEGNTKVNVSTYGTVNSSLEVQKLMERYPSARLVYWDDGVNNWVLGMYVKHRQYSDDNIKVENYDSAAYQDECSGAEVLSSTHYHEIRRKADGDMCLLFK